MFCCPSFAMLMYSCGRTHTKNSGPVWAHEGGASLQGNQLTLGLVGAPWAPCVLDLGSGGSAEGRELGLEAQQLQEVVLVTYIRFPRLGVQGLCKSLRPLRLKFPSLSSMMPACEGRSRVWESSREDLWASIDRI